MDPRHHVGDALVRVVRRPGTWPPRDLAQLRNLVLDESGGDFRIHVVFLMQLAELGLPQGILAATADGAESWDAVRNRLTLTLATERFILPEMARWGIDCWGTALGVRGATIPAPMTRAHSTTAPPSTRPAEPPRAAPGSRQRPRHVVAPVVGATGRAALHGTPPAALVPIPSWVKPGKVPPVPRWIAGSHVALAAQTVSAQLSQLERRAFLSLAALSALALGVMWVTHEPGERPAARVDERLLIGAESTASELTSPHTALRARPSRASDAPEAPTSSTLRAIRPVASNALAGDFRLTVRRSAVDGESRCNSIDERIRWSQESVEQIRVSSDGRRFDFVTRPGLYGSLASTGEFVSRVITGERDGTRSSFQLRGWVTPSGFRATGETRTTTLLRWRQTLRCRFVAELTGERIRPIPPAPEP